MRKSGRWIRASRSRPASSGAIAAALLAFAALAPSGNAAGQPLVQPLLRDATPADDVRFSLQSRRPQPGVVRQKPVQFDVRRFAGQLKAAPADLQVDLFDAQSVTLVPERLERRADGNFTWHGKVKGVARGFAMITVVDGHTSGTIDVGDGARYQLQSTPDGLTLLRQLDGAAFPDDHPGAGELIAPGIAGGPNAPLGEPMTKGGLADDVIAKADAASTVDVMIVYSDQTGVAAGAAIGAQAQQAVDTANLVYANSGIATRLRLVDAGPANYDESGDFNTDLTRLRGNIGIALLREQYGADLVSLLVENGLSCGLAWIGPSASYAFSVINRGCASANPSYPRELGHNFGARHDMYVDAAATPYAYGHGWVDMTQRWRDVMAYNNACAAYGVSCIRIPYFSNPLLGYGSPAVPTGSPATADATRVHRQSQHRRRPVQRDAGTRLHVQPDDHVGDGAGRRRVGRDDAGDIGRLRVDRFEQHSVAYAGVVRERQRRRGDRLCRRSESRCRMVGEPDDRQRDVRRFTGRSHATGCGGVVVARRARPRYRRARQNERNEGGLRHQHWRRRPDDRRVDDGRCECCGIREPGDLRGDHVVGGRRIVLDHDRLRACRHRHAPSHTRRDDVGGVCDARPFGNGKKGGRR